MNHIKPPSTERSHSADPDPASQVHDQLVAHGAEQVHPDFTAVLPGQHEVVYDESRLLIMARDQTVADNAYVATLAGLASLSESKIGSNDAAIVFDVPRDARTLTQVAVSTGNQDVSNIYVYAKFGEAIRAMAVQARALPSPELLDLHSVLYSRLSDQVILNPGTILTPYTSDALESLNRSVQEQLASTYKHFEGGAMYSAYLGGSM